MKQAGTGLQDEVHGGADGHTWTKSELWPVSAF